MKELILWQIKDNIGYLVLHDPPSNKMSIPFFYQLNDTIRNKIKKSGISAIIISGSGRHFSSGADLKDLLKIISKKSIKVFDRIIHTPLFLRLNNKSFLFFNNLKIPVIAAIQGVCLGSAMELMLSCHARICSDNAVFGFPESTFNLMPGLGGTCKILNYLKYSKALELILKGETFGAEEALKLNLVDSIVPKNALMDQAVLLAKRLSEIYKNGKLYAE